MQNYFRKIECSFNFFQWIWWQRKGEFSSSNANALLRPTLRKCQVNAYEIHFGISWTQGYSVFTRPPIRVAYKVFTGHCRERSRAVRWHLPSTSKVSIVLELYIARDIFCFILCCPLLISKDHSLKCYYTFEHEWYY